MEEGLSKSASFLPILISFLAGFVTAIFAEPIRRAIFKPNLSVGFGESKDYITHTPEILMPNKKTQAYYIRVKVTNESSIIARDCRAYLINIEKEEKKNGKSKFLPTIYCDSIQLAWSCQKPGEQFIGIDANKGVNQYVDIIATRYGVSEFEPQIMVKPFRYNDLFKEVGTYRFSIQVSTANANPKIIKLIFEWKGVWNDFKVYPES